MLDRTAESWKHFALMCAIVVAILLLYRLAHAAPEANQVASIASSWEVWIVAGLAALAGLETLLKGLAMIVRAISRLTKTTVDDDVADGLEAAHAKIGEAFGILNGLRLRSQPPPTSPLAPIAMLVIILGAGVVLQPACATLKATPDAAKTTVIECGKQEAEPILRVAAELGIQAALSALDRGAIDWTTIEDRAAAVGKVVGGCALVRFVAELEQAPHAESVAAWSLVAPADPVADGHVAVRRLGLRLGGVTWQ